MCYYEENDDYKEYNSKVMANAKYANNGTLYTTMGVLNGLKDVSPKIDPYYMESCDLPDRPNGFKLLLSKPIWF